MTLSEEYRRQRNLRLATQIIGALGILSAILAAIN